MWQNDNSKTRPSRKVNTHRGVTLVEVLCALGILGLLLPLMVNLLGSLFQKTYWVLETVKEERTAVAAVRQLQNDLFEADRIDSDAWFQYRSGRLTLRVRDGHSVLHEWTQEAPSGIITWTRTEDGTRNTLYKGEQATCVLQAKDTPLPTIATIEAVGDHATSDKQRLPYPLFFNITLGPQIFKVMAIRGNGL